LEDKIGLEISKPLLISQEGAFFLHRKGVGAMDCESDMAEGDMRRNLFFSTRNLPSLQILKET
jgi:hypothetical protein